MGWYQRKITVDDKAITEGVGLTLKQSIFPCILGILFGLDEWRAEKLISNSHHSLLLMGFRLRSP